MNFTFLSVVTKSENNQTSKLSYARLVSDVLPFGRLWYAEPNAVANAIGYAEHRSRSHDAVIRIYDDAGQVIEKHEHAGDFK